MLNSLQYLTINFVQSNCAINFNFKCKCAPETNSRPLFSFLYRPKYNQCIQETLLDIKYYEIGFSQKCNFIFIFKLSLFYGHYYEKQKLAIYVSKFLFISDPSPGKFQCFNSRRFSSYSGSINLYFMLAISWCHNYPMFNFILG